MSLYTQNGGVIGQVLDFESTDNYTQTVSGGDQLIYVGTYTNHVDNNFYSQNFTVADISANDYIVVTHGAENGSGTNSVSSVTVGGKTASQLAFNNSPTTQQLQAGIYGVNASGLSSTFTVTINLNGGLRRIAFSVYVIRRQTTAVPSFTVSTNGGDPSTNKAVSTSASSGNISIAVSYCDDGASVPAVSDLGTDSVNNNIDSTNGSCGFYSKQSSSSETLTSTAEFGDEACICQVTFNTLLGTAVGSNNQKNSGIWSALEGGMLGKKVDYTSIETYGIAGAPYTFRHLGSFSSYSNSSNYFTIQGGLIADAGDTIFIVYGGEGPPSYALSDLSKVEFAGSTPSSFGSFTTIANRNDGTRGINVVAWTLTSAINTSSNINGAVITSWVWDWLAVSVYIIRGTNGVIPPRKFIESSSTEVQISPANVGLVPSDIVIGAYAGNTNFYFGSYLNLTVDGEINSFQTDGCWRVLSATHQEGTSAYSVVYNSNDAGLCFMMAFENEDVTTNKKNSGVWDIQSVYKDKAVGGGGGGLSGEYITTSSTGNTSFTSRTFSSMSIGDADPNRTVAVTVGWNGGGLDRLITSATIGGINATVVQTSDAAGWERSAIIYANVPTGTTADITINWNTTVSYGAAIGVFRLLNVSNVSSYFDAKYSQGGVPYVTSVTTPAGNSYIISSQATGSGGVDWTNITERYTYSQYYDSLEGASIASTTAGTVEVTATGTSYGVLTTVLFS